MSVRLLATAASLLLAAQVFCACSGSDDEVSDPLEEPVDETNDASSRRDASSDARARTDGGTMTNPSDDDDDDEDDDSDDDADDDDATPTPTADSGIMSGRDASQGVDSDAGDGMQPAGPDGGGAPSTGEKFSFFMTSLRAMRELSKDQNGFGGDLRFGETGENAGLKGADKICTTIAEKSMPGSGAKGWRAFLSATKGGEGGGPVHAIDRVGQGPWYDRRGRLVAMARADLAQARPATADTMIKNDLPNEDGIPNHNPDGTGEVDNHHVLTGSNAQGQLYMNSPTVTCSDWTKSTPDQADAPRVGLSWPRQGRGGGGGAGAQNWISAMDESGCGKGVSIVEMGGPNGANPTVGSGGGYGAIYCFALKP
jgi:hypothetical protein